ncbi:MAG TPA: extracellular solute-binding protein [Methyloceanibacter sp.]|jgi:spermidine/putrescine transport system substrate-binding protein|nr:extracellular solute-binding protein [Methyloceanibacter sp.]
MRYLTSPTRIRVSRRALALTFALSAIAVFSATGQTAESTVKYFTWGGYDDASFRKPYIDKYGSGPEFIFYAHPDEAFVKLQSGFAADVAHPCIHDVKKWKDAGLLNPIDPAKVAGWNDLIPELRDAPALVLDGQHWLVPWEWGASSVIYRTDQVTPKEESFSILIDPALKGRTALVDAFDEVYRLAAVLAGVKDPLALEEAEYAKVEAMFRTLRDNARFVWTDPAQLQQALVSGEVVAAWGWPNVYKNLKKDKVQVAFMTKPKEKLVTWLCGIAHLKSAKAPETEIYDFINALEAPESGKALVENWGYGHANTKALQKVAPAELEALGISGDPSTFLANGNLLGPMPEEQRKRLTKMWDDIKAGG